MVKCFEQSKRLEKHFINPVHFYHLNAGEPKMGKEVELRRDRRTDTTPSHLAGQYANLATQRLAGQHVTYGLTLMRLPQQ